MDFWQSDLFSFVILPVLIFLSRICDVTIGTLRIILVSKGQKYIAPVLGFFEVLIWIVVIGKIMENLDNPVCYIAYAAGFATGNFIGMLVEEKLAMGVVLVRVITAQAADELISMLTLKQYGVTNIPAEGSQGRVHVIYSTVKRADLKNVVQIIKECNPKAFYTVEDIKYVNEGIFPNSSTRISILPQLHWRKGK